MQKTHTAHPIVDLYRMFVIRIAEDVLFQLLALHQLIDLVFPPLEPRIEPGDI